MYRIIQIVFLIISFQSLSQDIEVLGKYVYYEKEDSIAYHDFDHIRMIYDSNFTLIYQEMKRELGNEDDDLFFEDFRKSPELTIKGFITKTDTIKYVYSQNCLTGEKFIINDGDTTHIYKIECLNNEVVSITYLNDEYYNKDTLIKTENGEFWKITMTNGDVEYIYREFDSKGRLILSRDGLKSMTDFNTGNFHKFEFNDRKFTEKVTHSRVGVEDKYGDFETNYYDENWILIKKESIELHNGIKTLRIFEYTRIE